MPLAATGVLDDNLSTDSYVIVVTETDYIRQTDFDGEKIDFREMLRHRPSYRSRLQEDKLERSNPQLNSLQKRKQLKLKRPTMRIKKRPTTQQNNSFKDRRNSSEIKISSFKTPSFWVNNLYPPHSSSDNPPQIAHSRSQSSYSDILLQYYQPNANAIVNPTAKSRTNIVDNLEHEKRRNDNPGFLKQGKFPDYNYFINNILKIQRARRQNSPN